LWIESVDPATRVNQAGTTRWLEDSLTKGREIFDADGGKEARKPAPFESAKSMVGCGSAAIPMPASARWTLQARICHLDYRRRQRPEQSQKFSLD
jgi:hypothetical protein